MRAAGMRAHLDARSETLKYGRRGRAHEGAVHVRRSEARGRERTGGGQRARAGKEQKPAPVGVDEFIANVLAEVKSRSSRLDAGAAGTGKRERGAEGVTSASAAVLCLFAWDMRLSTYKAGGRDVTALRPMRHLGSLP